MSPPTVRLARSEVDARRRARMCQLTTTAVHTAAQDTATRRPLPPIEVRPGMAGLYRCSAVAAQCTAIARLGRLESHGHARPVQSTLALDNSGGQDASECSEVRSERHNKERFLGRTQLRNDKGG